MSWKNVPTILRYFRMSKSTDKSAYPAIYIDPNLFPDINPLVCEFQKVIRFELAVWMTADATRMPAGRPVKAVGGRSLVSYSTGNE